MASAYLAEHLQANGIPAKQAPLAAVSSPVQARPRPVDSTMVKQLQAQLAELAAQLKAVSAQLAAASQTAIDEQKRAQVWILSQRQACEERVSWHQDACLPLNS